MLSTSLVSFIHSSFFVTFVVCVFYPFLFISFLGVAVAGETHTHRKRESERAKASFFSYWKFYYCKLLCWCFPFHSTFLLRHFLCFLCRFSFVFGWFFFFCALDSIPFGSSWLNYATLASHFCPFTLCRVWVCMCNVRSAWTSIISNWVQHREPIQSIIDWNKSIFLWLLTPSFAIFSPCNSLSLSLSLPCSSSRCSYRIPFSQSFVNDFPNCLCDDGAPLCMLLIKSSKIAAEKKAGALFASESIIKHRQRSSICFA